MKIKDLRSDRETQIGDTVEISGDSSVCFITTDKGYRLILDAFNMKKIADHYNSRIKENDRTNT